MWFASMTNRIRFAQQGIVRDRAMRDPSSAGSDIMPHSGLCRADDQSSVECLSRRRGTSA
jgi:hypothetical protein